MLFDTVKHKYMGTMLCRLAKVIRPEEIDYIAVNHVELDHAGAMPKVMEACKPKKVFCSPMGLTAIQHHFGSECESWPLEVVKSGDSVIIAKRSVRFLETRMLCWPNSMFYTYPKITR